MNGKVIAIAGNPGEGKTSFIKKYSMKLKTKQTVCYLRVSDDWRDPDILTFTNFIDFLKYAVTQKNTLFIIDEAFTCLPERFNIRLSEKKTFDTMLADFLVNARKLNNFIFIIFHAVAQIPSRWLVPYLDYLVRFATNDLLQYQIQRFKSFPQIVESFIKFVRIKKFNPVVLKLRR